jgi:hypothetical protein
VVLGHFLEVLDHYLEALDHFLEALDHCHHPDHQRHGQCLRLHWLRHRCWLRRHRQYCHPYSDHFERVGCYHRRRYCHQCCHHWMDLNLDQHLGLDHCHHPDHQRHGQCLRLHWLRHRCWLRRHRQYCHPYSDHFERVGCYHRRRYCHQCCHHSMDLNLDQRLGLDHCHHPDHQRHGQCLRLHWLRHRCWLRRHRQYCHPYSDHFERVGYCHRCRYCHQCCHHSMDLNLDLRLGLDHCHHPDHQRHGQCLRLHWLRHRCWLRRHRQYCHQYLDHFVRVGYCHRHRWTTWWCWVIWLITIATSVATIRWT